MISYPETSSVFTNSRKSIRQSILGLAAYRSKTVGHGHLDKNDSKNIADDDHSDDTQAEVSGLLIIIIIVLFY